MNLFKHLIKIIAFIIPFFGMGQIYRAYYNLDYQPNKTDTTRLKKLQILVFNKDISTFQDYDYMRSDSLFTKNMKLWGETLSPQSMEKTMYEPHTIIINKISTKTITNKTLILNSYEYSEKISFDWKLENITEKIGDFTCQKATTSFGGRDWIAWFSTEYPFFFGPHKFYGLPGIIVKLHDAEKNFVWEMKGIEKQNDDNFYDKNLMEIQGMGSTKLDKTKFLKLEKNFKKNPLGNQKEYAPDTNIEKHKRMQETEKRIIKKIEFLNNPIFTIQ